MATSLAAKATVSAAAEPPPGAARRRRSGRGGREAAGRGSRRWSSRSSLRPPLGGPGEQVGGRRPAPGASSVAGDGDWSVPPGPPSLRCPCYLHRVRRRRARRSGRLRSKRSRPASGDGGGRGRDRSATPARPARGALADMAAVDNGLGLAGGKLYAATPNGASFVVRSSTRRARRLVAVLEANVLGQFRTGAASGVAARTSRSRARSSASSAAATRPRPRSHVFAPRCPRSSRRRLLPDARAAGGFCERVGAERRREPPRRGHAGRRRDRSRLARPGPPGRVARAGALVVAAGANVVTRRELDNAVLERASFVCCDLDRGREARVGRPRRARAGRRARLARGRTSCTRSSLARSRAGSRTTTSSSSSRTGSPPGTSRSRRPPSSAPERPVSGGRSRGLARATPSPT